MGPAARRCEEGMGGPTLTGYQELICSTDILALSSTKQTKQSG